MSQSLNVVALISGGKDSFYSLLHCVRNGHTSVALANLYPHLAAKGSSDDGANSADEDIDSFMYQTVGHDIVPLHAKALDIPLYRRQICGSAVQTGRYYDSSQLSESFDETEDLIPLLKKVLAHHPEVNAVCSGAILSTYQRTRIESVASRLGLIPLAYLWQYPALPPPLSRGESFTGLLDDMYAAGCDSRIIKIASGGMEESVLWSNVCNATTRRSVLRGMAPFFDDHEFWLRGAVLGEGGEYETLAVDGPSELWKGRIEVDEERTRSVAGDGGVTSLRFRGANVVTKGTAEDKIHKQVSVPIPEMLDAQFVHMLSRIHSKLLTWETAMESPVLSDVLRGHVTYGNTAAAFCMNINVNNQSSSMTISNLMNEISDQEHPMQDVVRQLRSILHDVSITCDMSPPLSSTNIVFATILMRDMKDFASINVDYSTLFTSGVPNPPARKTIACGDLLPKDTGVSLSVMLDLGPLNHRRGLHVQSRSYWAPANIGPYSQAIAVPVDKDEGEERHDRAEIVHVAGQIPLVPSSMEMAEGTFVEQAILALQHLWRVGQERGVDCWTHGVAYLSDDQPSASEHKAEAALEIWRTAHQAGTRPLVDHVGLNGDNDGDESPDAWDLKHNRFGSRPALPLPGNHLHILPNPKVFKGPHESTPPCIIAQVDSLPRSAPIEWHSLGLGNMPKSPDAEPRLSSYTERDSIEDTISAHKAQVQNIVVQAESDHGQLHQTNHNRHTNFITMQIPPRPDLIDQQGHPSVTITELINNTLASHRNKPKEQRSSTEESPTQKLNNEIVHGTIYIALENGGWPLAGSLRVRTELLQLTVIPCRRLWGQSNSFAEDGGSLVDKLAIALTMRVDTS